MADSRHLPYLKKESQEVCFVKDENLPGFLKKWIKPKKGEIIELRTDKKIGEHQGVQFYTIGQRVPVGGTGPYYVFSKNSKKNQLIVIGKGDKRSFHKELRLKNVNWLSGKIPKSQKVFIRTRYRQPLIKTKFVFNDSGLRLIFDKPVKFAAPGQSAVLYSEKGPASANLPAGKAGASGGRELFGGGIIM